MTRVPLMLILALSLSGCALRSWMFPPAPFSERAPCAIPPSMTKEQLVQHLNKNIQGSATSSGLASWRSVSCKITATGMPAGMSVPASIAVEAPRNFRLIVSVPLTRAEALDMGSNHEHFWLWAKDAQPQQVITVSHDDLPSAQQQLRVPFDPDWLMEVLGVIPIDPTKFTLKRGRADAPTYELISESLDTAGEVKKKVIRVDVCHGIIREHALYDGRGILIARAALADHRIDQATGLIVPHVISFDWPAMQQSMKIIFGGVELNPSQMPSQLWTVPQKPGAPRMDLSTLLGNRGHAHPSLYGVGSPFGIMPPPEEWAIDQASFESDDTSHTMSRTTFETGIDWDDEQYAVHWADDEQPGASRVHLTHPEIRTAAEAEPPSTYSPAASQSSSDRHLLEQESWHSPPD